MHTIKTILANAALSLILGTSPSAAPARNASAMVAPAEARMG